MKNTLYSAVQFSVKGYNLDQLINKLQRLNINIFNLVRKEVNCLEFCVSLKDFKKTKQGLKNYEYKFKLLGLANFKQFIIKNLACFLLTPIAIFLVAFSTKFIWNIKIYGGEGNLSGEVIQILSENNVKVGKRFSLNSQQIEQLLIKELPNVAQVSCIKRGTTIVINISKKLVYNPTSFEPITAKYNGVITSFNLIAGTIMVNVGDFVNKGDILVQPYTLDKEGNKVLVRPIAEIKAKAYIEGQANLPASEIVLLRTGKQHTISSINIFNRNLFSSKCSKPFDIYETSVYNENISSVIPIIRTKITYYEMEYRVVQHDLTLETPETEQLSKANAYLNLPENCEILDEEINSVIIQDCLYCNTTLTVLTIIS